AGRPARFVNWPAVRVLRGRFGFIPAALALLPHLAATGGNGIRVEAEKRRADSGAPLQQADYFDDEKWRAALSNRHYGFDRAQTRRASVAREQAATASNLRTGADWHRRIFTGGEIRWRERRVLPHSGIPERGAVATRHRRCNAQRRLFARHQTASSTRGRRDSVLRN